MPAAIPVVLQIGAYAAASAAGVGAVASAVIVGGAGILGGWVASELMGGADGAHQVIDLESARKNSRSTQKTIPVIYGERKIGSNDVYIERGRNNRDLWVVHCVGEGECEGIAQDEDGNDLVYVGGSLASEYEPGIISYTFHSGTNTQPVDSELAAGVNTEFNDPMRNTSYITFKFQNPSKNFAGLPTREVVIRGAKIYDFRDSVRRWTQNPALVLYDFLTNGRYGLGWDSSRIDTVTWSAAANYCDTYGWKINYVVASQIKSQAIIDTILGHFRGTLAWYSGRIFLHFAEVAQESVVFNISDAHIAKSKDGKAMVSVSQPDMSAYPTGVLVRYIDKEQDWTTDDVVLGEQDGYIKQLDFVGFTDRNLAAKMGLYTLERERLSVVFSFVLRSDAVILEVNDLITVTSSELAIDGQLVRVRQTGMLPSGLVQVTGVADDLALYALELDPYVPDEYKISMPGIDEAPPAVVDVVVEEEVYFYRGRSFVRLLASFESPSAYPWFSHVIVSSAAPTAEGFYPEDTDYTQRFTAANDFQIDPVEEGQLIFLRLNSVSIFGVEQSNENAAHVSFNVIGVSEDLPPCPEFIVATKNGSSVELKSEPVNVPDIEGYEFRVGDSWSEAILLTSVPLPVVSFNGVRPGTHKFVMATRNTNGRYCPTQPDVTLKFEEPPPHYRLFFEKDLNYKSGFRDNTEVTGTYPNQSIFCSQEDSNTVGTWDSVEIDTGNLSPYGVALIYVDNQVSVVYGAVTWATALSPITLNWESWAYISSEGRWKAWEEILGDETKRVPARVEVKLFYSMTSGGPYFEADKLEVLTAVVSAIYVKVRFTITDPLVGANVIVGPSTLKACVPVVV